MLTPAGKRAAEVLGQKDGFNLKEGQCVVAQLCTVCGADSPYFTAQIVDDIDRARAMESRASQYSPCHPNKGSLTYKIIIFGPPKA